MQDRSSVAFSEFLFEAKTYWMGPLFRAVRDSYERAAPEAVINSPEAAGALIEASPLYCYFAWLERHIQDEKYSGRYGLIQAFEANRDALQRQLAAVEDNEDLLTLDAQVVIPDYYAWTDTHQHPGNLHGDVLAGLIYKASAVSTQPGQTSGYALHERFADVVAAERDFKRVLDAGCGFGKSAITLAQRLTNATVEGVDLSAPCLRLAALEASQNQQRNLHYRQADVCQAPYEGQSFDLVTSTMLLHELPPDAVTRFFAETFRLLQPGGMVIHLDFRTEDYFLKFLHHEHGRRNNEPYMGSV